VPALEHDARAAVRLKPCLDDAGIRPAPLVMTMKFTIRSTQKITTPIRTDPPMMKLAKPSITAPAAWVPLCPCPMMSLVDETLSASRSISEASKIVGKDEKSSGRSMKSVMVKIRIAMAKEAASPISRSHAGTGRIIIAMIAMSASASSTVGRKSARMPEGAIADAPLSVLVPAFLLSEIARAFEIGFLIFLPFLVIDLVVAAILMSMGMMMVPPAVVALPFKLAFFVVADGWALLSGALVRSYV